MLGQGGTMEFVDAAYGQRGFALRLQPCEQVRVRWDSYFGSQRRQDYGGNAIGRFSHRLHLPLTMLIGYGYGYPTNMLQGGLAAAAWAAFNARATTDGAAAAEDAVNGCLQARFAVIFNF